MSTVCLADGRKLVASQIKMSKSEKKSNPKLTLVKIHLIIVMGPKTTQSYND